MKAKKKRKKIARDDVKKRKENQREGLKTKRRSP